MEVFTGKSAHISRNIVMWGLNLVVRSMATGKVHKQPAGVCGRTFVKEICPCLSTVEDDNRLTKNFDVYDFGS